MNPDADGKVVNFPAASSGPVCETCGSPWQTGAFCRNCAFQLVDLALSGGSKDGSTTFVEVVHPPDPEPRTTGLRYGHYQICESATGGPWELGRGSMGITYKALDTYLGRLAALKVINARHLGGAGARDRFLREARTSAQLRHPNIASVFHLGPDAQDCFYAMEFIEGETLEARVRREGALSSRLALNIVAQAARALGAAHAMHFIHRDIKPSNVMLMENGHGSEEDAFVKLIDFGLVKTAAIEAVQDGGWCQGYFAGTPHYASPEQLNGGVVDARSDIYSLGRCLEYMLLGGRPEPNVTGIKPAGLPLSVAGIPDPVSALLASMIAAAPASRPQSASELVLRVTECLATVETADEQGEDTVSPQRVNRGRAQKMSLALIGLLGFVACCMVAARWLPVRRGSLNPPTGPTISAESRALFAQGKEYFHKYTYAGNQLAIKSYSEAVALSPANAEAHAALASVYYDNVGRFGAPAAQLDLAVASAERAIAADPNVPDGFQVLAAIRNLQGQPWEALLQLHRALEVNPGFVKAMSDFGLLWTCVGRPELALPWATAATRIEPARVQSWHAAAEASVELCEDEQAERFYGRCLELKPMWMSGHCGLIHLHLLRGDFAQARQDFAKAESIQPGLIFPLTLKAQLDLFNGEYVEAEQTYRQLLTLKRDGYVRYYSAISYLSALGYLRLQAGDTVEGNAFLTEAEGLHPANSEGPEDVYDLAAIRAIQGRQEDALTLLSQAISSGWNDYRATRLDPRFSCLRGESRFHKMLKDLSVHVAAMRVRADQLCGQPLKLEDYPVNPVVRNGAK